MIEAARATEQVEHPAQNTRPHRVGFANALRGIAALSVIAGHYLLTFFTMPDAIRMLTGMPDHGLPLPAYVRFIMIRGFEWHVFGVAIFFLISGFVIPFSFSFYDRKSFLVARFMRIYPTYWIGFSVGILFLYFGGVILDSPFPNTREQTLISYLLGCRDIAWSKPVDGVVWTLEIELKFYLICALATPLIRRCSVSIFLIPVALCAITFVLSFLIPLANTVRLNFIALSSPYLLFMFIGIAFNFLYRGATSTLLTTAIVAALSAMFAASIVFGFFKPPILPSYAVAVVIFALAMKFPNLVTKLPLVNFWARISYPLYVVHALSGYVLLHLLLHFGTKAWISLLATFAFVTIVALVIHRFVEGPSRRLGRKLAKQDSIPLAFGASHLTSMSEPPGTAAVDTRGAV